MKYEVAAPPTALGEFVVIAPIFNKTEWMCICLNKKLQWTSSSCHKNKQAAQKERERLRYWHKLLAKMNETIRSNHLKNERADAVKLDTIKRYNAWMEKKGLKTNSAVAVNYG